MEFNTEFYHPNNKVSNATISKRSSELINEHIIPEAKRYLLATPNQIKDIADHLGYEDVSYFIRFFKKPPRHSDINPDKPYITTKPIIPCI